MNPYLPAPPRSLKKCRQGVRLVTREEMVLHMGHYNMWAASWNKQEEAFQNGEPTGPKHDSIHGHTIYDGFRSKVWLWHPNEGRWHLIVSPEINSQREYSCYIQAKLQNYRNTFYPRPFVSPDQVVWASWLCSGQNGRDVA